MIATLILGCGLGAGYRPTGHMGGEPNFSGQQNSLWLLQNDIGQIVYEGVHAWLQDRRRAA